MVTSYFSAKGIVLVTRYKNCVSSNALMNVAPYTIDTVKRIHDYPNFIVSEEIGS